MQTSQSAQSPCDNALKKVLLADGGSLANTFGFLLLWMLFCFFVLFCFKKFLWQANWTRPYFGCPRNFFIQLFPNWTACSPITYANPMKKLRIETSESGLWTIVKWRLSNHSNKMQSKWSYREGDCMQFDISFTRTGELSWRRLHNQRFYLNGHMTIVLINMGQARVIW